VKLLLSIIFGVTTAACVPKHETAGRRIVPDASGQQAKTQTTIEPAQTVLKSWSLRQGLWDAPRQGRAPTTAWTMVFDGPIVHPLVLDGEYVYAVSGGTVSKVRIDGTLVWSTDVEADGRPTPFSGGVLVPNRSGVMQLLASDSGDILESYGGFASVRTAALPLQSRYAWIERDGILITSDTQNGPIIMGPVSDAASDAEYLYVGNMHGQFAAVSENGIHWLAEVPGPVSAHPVIGDDQVFVPFGSKNQGQGGLAALNLADGVENWVAYFGSGPSAPAALGQFLIVPSRSGDLIALDPRHGGTRWRAPGTAIQATQPAIVRDAIYTCDGHGRLARFDMADGGSAWTVDLGVPITGDPVVTPQFIIVGTSDGRLLALSQ